jgi:cell wall-associated NlpC family hydrolase
MRAHAARLPLVLAVMTATLIHAHSALAFSDVPSGYWDQTAISYVATSHDWMRDFGTGQFRPKDKETRSLLARALVRAWTPSEATHTDITFADLPKTDPFYRYATIAVKHGWITKYSGNRWAGGCLVPRSLADQALTLAMGLTSQIRGLAGIHQSGGRRYVVGSRFPHMQLAASLGLHYNHGTESLDLQPATTMPRDEVAYSLYMSKVVPSWEITNSARLSAITLPSLPAGTTPERLTQYALDQVGYPYIWAGEWNTVSPSGYCCGFQPQGGFDCSGFMWWILKKSEDGYNSAQFRSYIGWSLHQRTSSTMAQLTPVKLSYGDLWIGNLMFFSSNGGNTWQDVDHVGMYVGNDWMIHSTGGGPQLEWVGGGWYHDHFVYGRGLTSSGPSSLSGQANAAQATNDQGGDPEVDDGRAVAVDTAD